MKEFALLFRQPSPGNKELSATEMQAIAQKWQDWIGSIIAEGKYAPGGQRLAHEGKVLRGGGIITDGPFAEIREILGGFLVIKAEDLDEATTLAHGCPALETGGSVEIRPLMAQ